MKRPCLATMTFAASALLVVALARHDAEAAVKAQAVTYKAGDATLEGYVAFDDAAQGKRPGVVVFPDYFGVTDYAEARARKLAALGYVVFVGDLFGKGVRPKTDQEAGAVLAQFRTPGLLQSRYEAALNQLRADPHVDQGKLVAMGYCFGASSAFGLARSGTDLVATVLFHGYMSPANPAAPDHIKGHLLAFWGANDPRFPAKAVDGFADELRQTQADWEIVTYANAVHSFTNPNAHSATDAYNAIADRRSWSQTQQFLHEVLR
jgi:dienelactone hydrolase